jgi:hypothetical protein
MSALGVPERFWIVIAGGKYDFTAKWRDPAAERRTTESAGTGEAKPRRKTY